MAPRTVMLPPRDAGLAGCPPDLDAALGLNGNRAAAPGLEIGKQLPELEGPAPAEDGAALAFTLRPNRIAREIAALAQRVEELETDLKQRGRRLQQLMGERDELRSLLARRDVELFRLNREIGALAARAEPAADHAPVLFAAARSLLDRFQRARHTLRGPKPTCLRPLQPDTRNNGARLVPWVKRRPSKDVLAVVLFGLSEPEIERVLQAIERYCTEHEIAPLLLTDNDSFELFRNRRVLFEYLPARSEQERLAADLDWRLYTLRRLALIRRKWKPSRVVAFGHRASEVMRLWLNSPFEETPIPATSTAGLAGNEPTWSEAQAGAR